MERSMEYDMNPKFDTVEIKNVDTLISIYKLTRTADISIRYVTEEFIQDLYKKFDIKLEPRTLGGKKYYVFKVDGMSTNITFWIKPNKQINKGEIMVETIVVARDMTILKYH